jgi:hypothetical protein
MSQKTSRIRAILLRKLKAHSSKTWQQIARECDVHVGTIRRWLKGEEARFEHIELLAKAVGTIAEELMLPQGETDTTDYVRAEMTLNAQMPVDIEAILREAQKAIGPKYRLLLMYVAEGSVKVGIWLHPKDGQRLLKAFMEGKLTHLNVIAVRFITADAKPPYTTDISKHIELVLQKLIEVRVLVDSFYRRFTAKGTLDSEVGQTTWEDLFLKIEQTLTTAERSQLVFPELEHPEQEPE